MTVVLAHPLTEAARLGVAPAFVALLAAVVTVGVARVAAVAGGGRVGQQTTSADRSRTRAMPLVVVGRVLGLALLVLAIVAGRLGTPAQIDNIAPALIVGVGWPAMLLGSALSGAVWDWLNPFDTLARGVEQLGGPGVTPPTPHRLLWLGAASGALGWTWWLAGHVPGGLEPRAIGLALAAYSLATIAGCLWAGREAWLSQGEVFTVTFRAISAARSTAAPPFPPAQLPTLALLIGGLAYAEMRFSAWYRADLAAVGVVNTFATPVVLAGFVIACGVGVVSAIGAARWSRRVGAIDALHTAMPWLVVGLGLSAAIERDRLWNAVQLLWLQTSDPLGRGWDLWDTAGRGVIPWPHGDVGRLWLQVAVLVVAAMVGLAIGLRRADGRAGEPVVVFVGGWLVLAVLSAASL